MDGVAAVAEKVKDLALSGETKPEKKEEIKKADKKDKKADKKDKKADKKGVVADTTPLEV